ncbi:MAG: hypothetical protein RLZZ468_1499 [Cyanobacteriota bacterium]|jgi:hypothetical protein
MTAKTRRSLRRYRGEIGLSAMISLSLQRYARRLHRTITPILVAPIMLTAFTGALHPMLRSAGVDKDSIRWIIRIHSGNFYIINLKPVYPLLVGLSTLILAATGLVMYVRVSRRLAHHHPSAEQPGTP